MIRLAATLQAGGVEAAEAEDRSCQGKSALGAQAAWGRKGHPLQAFKEETEIEFVDTPLADVLDYLSHKHRIPIIIDRPALKEAGVEESTPITFHLTGIPLRSALEIVLDELQVKWVIHHDVLMITSQNKADSDEFMQTRSYDVTDLITIVRDHEDETRSLPPRKPMGMADGTQGRCTTPAWATGDITDMVRPPAAFSRLHTNRYGHDNQHYCHQDVVDNGGTGTITNLDGMLAISQTLEIHMQIEHFLPIPARRRARPTLSVEFTGCGSTPNSATACWLAANPSEGHRSLALDPERLRQIAHEVPGFVGHVACQNGLGTVITAGDRRAIITGAIPVVGGVLAISPSSGCRT